MHSSAAKAKWLPQRICSADCWGARKRNEKAAIHRRLLLKEQMVDTSTFFLPRIPRIL
jgi:hypothetical protein